MISSLITLLVLALVMFVVWKYILGTFIPADINRIVGIIFGLILFLYAMAMFGVIQMPITR